MSLLDLLRVNCRIPDDHLSKRIWKFTLAREGLGKRSGNAQGPDTMIIKLHKQARITPAIRKEIQQATGTLAELAARYNVTIDTIRK